MALRDYILCRDCGDKLIYDGNDNVRSSLEEDYGDPSACGWTVELVCPPCLKKIEDKQAEPVAVEWLRRWANLDEGASTPWKHGYDAARNIVKIHLGAPQQAEPVVEAHRVLVVESLPAALTAANWRETKDVGDEDIAAKLRRLHRLEKVVEAIESGESFEVLEKLAAEFRKGLK